MSMRRSRPLAAWLAILAIALQTLWPLLAQAKPKNVVLVPVCTVQGVTHYVELPSGNAPVERKAASQHDHCAFCASGGERAALTSAVQVFNATDSSSSEVFTQKEESVATRPVLTARPRAPPLFPKVDLINHFRRKNEQATVVVPRSTRAGDAVAGRGILRRGVLHA